jgi:uncharacterized membrane protein
MSPGSQKAMIERLALLHSRSRCVLAVVLGILTFLCSLPVLHFMSGLVLSWNVGVSSWLFLVVLMMNHVNADEMRVRSQSREPRTEWMLFVSVAAAVAGLIAMAYMLVAAKDWSPAATTTHLTLSLVAVLASWMLTHTKFALHYARLYYAKNEPHVQWYAKGLQYAGDHPVDYWDFMYLSFTIAMTAAVSDVDVPTPAMRRFVLLHAIISFFFYTIILGLVLNAVSALI